MKTGIITTDTYLNHNTGEGHPERADRVSAIIDNRKHTILACTLAFGQTKVSFYPNEALGFVQPVTKEDLIIDDKLAIRSTLFLNGFITLQKSLFLKTYDKS